MNSKDFHELLQAVHHTDLSHIQLGKQAYAENGNVKIWYEHIMPKHTPKATLVFVMGLDMHGLAWPNSMLQFFVEHDYSVIRFDNRCTGMSSNVKNFGETAFTFKDMANDIVAILNKEECVSCYLIGVSMGGMISQEFALNYPAKTKGAISIMSSGNIYDSSAGGFSYTTLGKIMLNGVKHAYSNSENTLIKRNVRLLNILKGTSDEHLEFNEVVKQLLYNHRVRKARDFMGGTNQIIAMRKSGSRLERLKDTPVPFLIIHGEKDPFIPVAHSKKLAEIIPNNESLFIENMGHLFSQATGKLCCERILTFVEKNNNQ